ncbi:MAG: DoxX family protein [Acidobacteria bacterium]|nr:MAG: DoxX family protein [Acidobacteriota bacterium]REJ97949.1 MAG: DoxX family protein [Acidobacteriota bacterium]REK16692.1 MAG: DoxX family protein [Acidobacteriota bacterium]REK42603.1 MAG: DoxX family protein [Acidobacteriota bacterium]
MASSVQLIGWAARIAVAAILLQTLFFKFTGAEESRYIFTTLMGPELEAYGRIGSGVVELIAAVLILIPQTAWLGSLIAVLTILGAIFSHLTRLGIEVKGDGGLLFALALVVLVLGTLSLLLNRKDIPFISAFLPSG